LALLSASVAAALLMVQGTTLAANTDLGPSRYYRAVSDCRPAKQGFATCFAMHLVRVTRNTPGARQMALPKVVPHGPVGGYTPGDLAIAYGVNSNAPTSQIVAIVDAFHDPNALVDLNAFDTHYGLPHETATSFKQLNQNGAAGPYPVANAGWATEIALDIEAVRGICHTCQIRLYEATDNSNANLGAAVDKAVAQGAKIVSNSYGGHEGAAPDPAAGHWNHPGVAILASTGDHGMFDWDNFNLSAHPASSNAPEEPSSYNTVVAVGGTSLFLNANATRATEVVWNENGSGDMIGFPNHLALGATGGGCSKFYAARPLQHAIANYADTTCGTKKAAADVSALADPYTGFDTLNTFSGPTGGWGTEGGTSLASPLIAGMWALAGGPAGVAYPADSLYKHLKNNPADFFDVTGGGNGLCNALVETICGELWSPSPNQQGKGVLDCATTPGGAPAAGRRECDAAIGYDGPSGVGTPRGLAGFKP
jgi:subtilase family serine protease